MTIDCPREALLEAAQLAGAPATGRTTTLPIFESLLFEAKNGSVRLVGCDGEMWVERLLGASVSEPGSLAVKSRLLTDILSSLPDGQVHIEQPNSGSLRLSLASSDYRMVGMPSDDFPEIPKVSADSSLKMKAADFARMVTSVDFAVAAENQGRAILTGVLFHYDGEKLRTVATDTHRLAVRTEAFPGIGSEVTAIVPNRTIQVIKRLPVAEDGELTLTFGDGRLMVEADGARVVAQLLEGEFPPYDRVVPSEHTRRWLFDKETLALCLKRASILARDNAQRVVMKSEGDRVLLEARSEGVGEGKEEIQIVKEGDDLEVAFNGRYLLDALTPIETDGAAMELTENDRPTVLRPSEPGTDYFCVIMPMALM
ncbi:MAG: DNA polymerase III subunit beta [Armatimonadetes bacterium]|nr:DNA polymerase III subunit beta [Armatimonadota bacterium]